MLCDGSAAPGPHTRRAAAAAPAAGVLACCASVGQIWGPRRSARYGPGFSSPKTRSAVNRGRDDDERTDGFVEVEGGRGDGPGSVRKPISMILHAPLRAAAVSVPIFFFLVQDLDFNFYAPLFCQPRAILACLIDKCWAILSVDYLRGGGKRRVGTVYVDACAREEGWRGCGGNRPTSAQRFVSCHG